MGQHKRVYRGRAGQAAHYDWTLTDRIFDTYRARRHLKPYVQIGFMPEALSTRPTPYQHRLDAGKEAANCIRAGRTRRKITRAGPNWCINGRGIALNSTGAARPQVVGLGSLERTQHRVLARNARRVPEAVRLRRRCGATRPARSACRRAGESREPAGRARRAFCALFLEHCARGTNYATGKVGSPARLHLVPRQRYAAVRKQSRSHGHLVAVKGH